MHSSTLLDQLGSMLDPDRPGPDERVHRRIEHAIATPPAGPAHTRRRLVTIASLAAVLTVVTLTAQTVRIAGRPPASVASAADILNHAARAADGAPDLTARPDQFVFVEWMAN